MRDIEHILRFNGSTITRCLYKMYFFGVIIIFKVLTVVKIFMDVVNDDMSGLELVRHAYSCLYRYVRRERQYTWSRYFLYWECVYGVGIHIFLQHVYA